MDHYSFWNSDPQEVTDFPQALELSTHSGPRLIRPEPGENPRSAISAYMRRWCEFLTDDNHWMRFEVKPSGGLVYIHHTPPHASPNRVWFSHSWRIVSPVVFERDIEGCRQRIINYEDQITRCRDTVRGRRSAKGLRSSIGGQNGMMRVYADHRQKLINGETYGPQYRDR